MKARYFPKLRITDHKQTSISFKNVTISRLEWSVSIIEIINCDATIAKLYKYISFTVFLQYTWHLYQMYQHSAYELNNNFA